MSVYKKTILCSILGITMTTRFFSLDQVDLGAGFYQSPPPPDCGGMGLMVYNFNWVWFY
jgi:hypothetical protein